MPIGVRVLKGITGKPRPFRNPTPRMLIPTSLLLRGSLTQGCNLRAAAELLVVAVGHIDFDVEVLQQRHSYIDFDGYMLLQPDFVVNADRLDCDARAFVDAGQE